MPKFISSFNRALCDLTFVYLHIKLLFYFIFKCIFQLQLTLALSPIVHLFVSGHARLMHPQDLCTGHFIGPGNAFP